MFPQVHLTYTFTSTDEPSAEYKEKNILSPDAFWLILYLPKVYLSPVDPLASRSSNFLTNLVAFTSLDQFLLSVLLVPLS